ncbi:MAG: C45 family autoproteolytic acyltransferase/hydrolase [Rubrivivax sp.]|nr:C45 family autoproteolytic acyltransferase/hydrolase [Rubrivivax sp.]
MRLSFHAIADGPDGAAWTALTRQLWPAYHRWYESQGLLNRPTYRDCRVALHEHMPEFVPEWERLVGLAGGGDGVARFLSLWNPPAYVSACSQAVWPGSEPLLVRNYDYTSLAFDGVCLHTQWGGRTVMGTSDCLIGLVDGINDAGLALSLTFGGRRDVGQGFGVPLILRYVLQTCVNTAQAGKALRRIPSHMAYNVTVVDARRQVLTAQLTPGQATRITSAAVATNHQPGGPVADRAQMTATVERERYLLSRLMLHDDSADKFIGAFLRPPLYSLAFERGFGTLFTAAYWPRRRTMSYHWPGYAWPQSLTDFVPAVRDIVYPV